MFFSDSGPVQNSQPWFTQIPATSLWPPFSKFKLHSSQRGAKGSLPQVLPIVQFKFSLLFHSPLLLMESKGSVGCGGLLSEHSGPLRAGGSHCQ